MDRVSKVEKTEGKKADDGANIQNPFLCKGKHWEDCKECNHSPGEVAKQTRGVSSGDIRAFLFIKPHSLATIWEMKETLEKCYVPDCGTPFFLKDVDKEWVRNECSTLSSIEEKACLVVKLSLVGCDDIVPEETLRTISGAISRPASLQNQLIEMLVRKRGATCMHYTPTEHACRDCGVVAGGNKKQEQMVYRDGRVSSQYTTLGKYLPSCLELKF
ncbi:MAG: hypothetical protein HZC03_01375 [Candidatus Lloydbacteria bacterium]|nr:hypothetical protein [Candidatus Lloydbacteria bacterium]